MNENDDVMGFNDEPEINPSDFYTEPDFPHEPNETDQGFQDTSQSQTQPVENGSDLDMYAGYEDFEAMDPSDLQNGNNLNGNNYQQSPNKPDNTENYSDDDNADNPEAQYEEASQAKKILDTQPSEKMESKQNAKNKGVFLNRQRLLLIFAVIFVAFILYVFPCIKNVLRWYLTFLYVILKYDCYF